MKNTFFFLVLQYKTDFELFLKLFLMYFPMSSVWRQQCNGFFWCDSSNWFLLGFILFIQPGALLELLTFASNHHPLSSCFILKLVIIFLIYYFPTTVICIPDSSAFDLTLISIATHCSDKTHFVTCSQWFYRTDFFFIIIYSSINFCVICNVLLAFFLEIIVRNTAQCWIKYLCRIFIG